MTRYFTLIHLLLLAVAVYFAIQAYGTMTAPSAPLPVLTQKAEGPVPAQKAMKRSAPAGYRTIIKRNLFHTTMGSGPVPVKVDVEKLEQTKLSLKLWGTATGQDQEPYAVIEEKKARRQNLFRVGDAVENATIKIILREKVVLGVDGRDEILEMEKLTGSSSGGRPTAPRALQDSTARSDGAGPAAAGGIPTEQHIALDRDQMLQSMENVNDLLKQIRMRPHFKNGKPDGLSLTGIRPDSIFRKMGLRNGDIITGVDGEPVENANDAIEMMQQIGDTDGLQVQIKRRGRDQMLNYDIQ